MASVKSTWASTPITMDGNISGPEWSVPGIMSIPAGFLKVKNDSKYLYIALDLVGDQGNDAGSGDYFWISFDVDKNMSITPHQDVNYGLWPGQPNKLAFQYFLGPGTWTTIQPSTSLVRAGFGPSPQSAVPHRIWEMRLDLAEIGLPDLGSEVQPKLRFGLRLASSSPSFVFDFPANFYSDFTHLHEISLAKNAVIEPSLSGSVIASVGIIPFKKITDGYATTDPSYSLPVEDCAFGGGLSLVGNRGAIETLYAAGARKYRIRHRAGTSGAFEPLRQSWTNYLDPSGACVLKSYTWGSDDTYPLEAPNQDFSIKDLLAGWNTTAFAPGLHQIAFDFLTSAGAPVTSPAEILTVMVDNNLPMLDIVNVLHNGAPVSACAMEKMTTDTDGVKVTVSVNDAEGHLAAYSLTAHYGDGAPPVTVYSDAYAAHKNPTRKWTGPTTNQVIPAALFVPPVTCSYQFRLGATVRVTNGYCTFGYAEDTYHVTLIKPSLNALVTAKTVSVLGSPTGGTLLKAGQTATKLGADTFR